MTLEAHVLDDHSLRATPNGYELDLYLAWYRSLPLSCVEDIEVSIDGQRTPSESIQMRLNGVEHAFADLPALDSEWWFVQDPLTVLVPADEQPETGTRARVSVELATRIPYIIIGPETALVQRTYTEREVTVR